jgi:hypothetical protein
VNHNYWNDTDLAVGDFYQYRMSIRNEFCEGPSSPLITLSTTMAFPLGLVNDVRIMEATALPSLKLRWRIPENMIDRSAFRIQIMKLEKRWRSAMPEQWDITTEPNTIA